MAEIMQAEYNQVCLKLQRRSLSYAKVQIKSEKLTSFGGIFQIMEQFNILLGYTIDSTLGLRCTSDSGKVYDFNTAEALNTLLTNCLLSTGQLRVGEEYGVDFDHQFIEIEEGGD